jgi:hypothetical protein
MSRFTLEDLERIRDYWRRTVDAGKAQLDQLRSKASK